MRGNAGGNPGVRFLSGYAANFMESFIAGCYDKWEVPAILCVCVCVWKTRLLRRFADFPRVVKLSSVWDVKDATLIMRNDGAKTK